MAQIAFSAVSLEDLNKVHWTAKAAFVSSLIKGSLSVFYACLVQQNLSGLYSIEDVKSFFSKRALQEGFLFSKKKNLEITFMCCQHAGGGVSENGGYYEEVIESLEEEVKKVYTPK